MGEKIGVPLQFERRAEIKSRPTAKRSQERLQANQQHESNAKRKEQVAAAPEYKEDTPMVVLGASGSLQPLQAVQ